MYFGTEWTVIVQGHPRSFILAPVESAYAISYWLSVVSLVLSWPVSEILHVFCWKQHRSPIPPEFWGCFLWIRLPILGLRGAKTLSNYSSNYFRTNPTYTTTVHPRHGQQTDRQTDGRTDIYESNAALCTVRASRGNKVRGSYGLCKYLPCIRRWRWWW